MLEYAMNYNSVSIEGAALLRLRPACASDCRMIWEWANDPLLRSLSFSSDPIPWDSHVAWFERALQDPNVHLYIAESEVPVGLARFELKNAETVISVSIAREYRRRGLGRELIELASGRMLSDNGIAAIHAYIKPENAASISAFAAAGYEQLGEAEVKGVRSLHLVLRRER